MSRSGVLATISLLLSACSDPVGGVGGIGALCGAGSSCPSGQFCYNGICAVGCNSNGDCAKDQYCDTDFDCLCHNKTVTTCPDTPCASGYSCVKGLCTPPAPSTSCTPRFDGQDGCESNALCLPEGQDSAKCYAFPYCPEGGQCPVGTDGAVCNDGLIPGKARICLTNACKTIANCPAAWRCVRFDAADVLGSCSNGSRFSPCTIAADCHSGLDCVSPAAGFPGHCDEKTLGGPGASCQTAADCMPGLVCASPAPGFPSQCGLGGGSVGRGGPCQTTADCAAGLTCGDPGDGFPICG